MSEYLDLDTYATESEGTRNGKGVGQGCSALVGSAGSEDRGQRGGSTSSSIPSQPRNQRHTPAGVPGELNLFLTLFLYRFISLWLNGDIE